MILNKRERTLAIAVAALLVAFIGWQVFAAISDPLGQLRAQQVNLANDLERKTREKETLAKTKARLEDWQRRSLPTDVELASGLYLRWLSGLAQKCFSTDFKQRRPVPSALRGIYDKLHVIFDAQGTLDELTRFLHGFYSAGHLHMVYNLMIEPGEKPGEMKFTITVEALILPGADRKKELTKLPGNRLASADVNAYKVIAERNLLAPYASPKPLEVAKAPPPKLEFDPSRYAYATAIVGGRDGRLEVWLRKRTTDETLTLHEGDPLEVGPFKGMVARISPREFEILLEGEPNKPYVVAIGDNLRGTESAAKPSGPEGPPPKPDVKPAGPPEIKPPATPETGARAKVEIDREAALKNRIDRRRGGKKSRGGREEEK